MKEKKLYLSSCLLTCSVCQAEFKSQRSLSNHLAHSVACASKKRRKVSLQDKKHLTDNIVLKGSYWKCPKE